MTIAASLYGIATLVNVISAGWGLSGTVTIDNARVASEPFLLLITIITCQKIIPVRRIKAMMVEIYETAACFALFPLSKL